MIKKLTVLMLLTASLYAQDTYRLSIDEAVSMGVQSSRLLGMAEKKISGAEARTSETFAQRLPSLKLGASYTRLSDVPDGRFTIPANAFGPGAPPVPVTSTISPAILNSYGLRATVQQPVFTGFRLENNQRLSELSASAIRFDYADEKGKFVHGVREAYWGLFRAIEVKKVVDENIEQVKAHLKDARNLLAQGFVTNNDVLKVEVQLSNAQLMGIDAKNAVRMAMMNLCYLTDLPLDTKVEIISTPGLPVNGLEPMEVRVEQALRQRPDLKALASRLEAAKTAVDIARGSNYPQVMLVGNYSFNRPNQRFFPVKDEFKGTWDVGLQIGFDVWNGGQTKYQTHQAMAQLHQVSYSLELLEMGIRLEIAREYLAEQQAREKIDVAKETVRQAEESYRITSEKYKRGVALTTDLLDAEVAVLQAKTSHTQALVDYELARTRLARVTGEL